MVKREACDTILDIEHENYLSIIYEVLEEVEQEEEEEWANFDLFEIEVVADDVSVEEEAPQAVIAAGSGPPGAPPRPPHSPTPWILRKITWRMNNIGNMS